MFIELGSDIDEQTFIDEFKRKYPLDWVKINEKWKSEENSTPPGKRHPMQHPDVYMHEMYRNHKPRAR